MTQTNKTLTKTTTYGTVLIKANLILDALSQRRGTTLTEIATQTNLTRSTTLKILETLQQINYVNKDDLTKTYRIGPAFLKYSEAFLADFNIVRLCQPHLLKLRDEFGETVHLGGLDSDALVYLDKFPGKKSITVMTSKIGVRAPLYATGMGKAILSTFDSQELAEYLDTHPLLALTDTTITNRKTLLTQLEEAKNTGITHDNAERDEDVYCIATTIVYHQKLFGSFSISVPRYRIDSELTAKMINEILKTKAAIESDLKQMSH